MDFKPIQFKEDVENHFLNYFSKSHFEKICKALSTPPLTTYFRKTKYTEEENVDEITSFDSFQTKIQNFVDRQCEEKQWKKIELKKCPIDILSNQVLCYPIEVMDKKTFENMKKYEKEVIVDIHCGKSILRGSDIYAPGLLAMSQNVKLNDMVSIYVDVNGKILRGACGPFEKTDLLFIGNGQILVNRNEIYTKTPKELQGLGVKMMDIIYKSPSFGSDEDINNMVFLQNLPSLLCAALLKPKPNQLLLDMCSAPGGKTMHLANITKNKAKIIALDKSAPKIKILNEDLKKFDFSSVKAYNVDATKLVSPLTKKDCLSLNPELLKTLNIQNETFSYDTVEQFLPSDKQKITFKQIKKSTLQNKNEKDNNDVLNKFKELSSIRCSVFPDESFDAILLDPPCSALGQRPMFSCDMTLENLLTFHSYQRALFKVAHRLLKPGGRIIFSTCTFNPKENEEQVAWVLNTFKDMKLENLREIVPFAQENIPIKPIQFDFIEDLDEQKRIPISPSLMQKINQSTLRFDPGDDICFKDDTIGFYISSFTKTKFNIYHIFYHIIKKTVFSIYNKIR